MFDGHANWLEAMKHYKHLYKINIFKIRFNMKYLRSGKPPALTLIFFEQESHFFFFFLKLFFLFFPFFPYFFLFVHFFSVFSFFFGFYV